MANEFDPYREALVVETRTTWGDEYDGWEADDRQRAEELLHAEPESAAELHYDRMHTGFCRVITVTEADLERIGVT